MAWSKRLWAILLLVCILAGLAPGAASSEQFFKVTVTFYGDTRTEKAFTWYTKDDIARSDLQVAPYTAEGADFSRAVTFSGSSGASGSRDGELWHKAVAKDLQPGTKYAFRVGDQSLARWSRPGTFETAGEGPFTFVCLTDTQAGNLSQSRISADTISAALKLAQDCKFILHSGDVVDTGAKEEEWDWMLKSCEDSLMNMTIAPVAGNHERAAGVFDEHFNLNAPAGADRSRGVYYSFTYGSVHFVNLNTNETSDEYAALSTAQAEWLKSDIAKARQNGAARIVINLHKGMYNMGAYAKAADVTGKTGQRTKLAPLLEELGADLVLQGHDHFACRTQPLRGGKVDPYGTTYLNCNAAGVKVYKRDTSLSESYLSLFAYYNKKTPEYGRYQNFAIITVDAHANMKGTLYEIDRKGASSPYVVDSFYLPNMQGDAPFYDVRAEEWYYEPISHVNALGVMGGVGAGSFAPNQRMNRAMLLAALHRLEGSPKGFASPFLDVAPSDWYSDAVGWAYAQGVVSGRGDGTFGATDALTREQAAAILYRYAGGEVDDHALAPFADRGEASPYARSALCWAIGCGIMSGRGGDVLDPQGFITRAEAAAMISRLIGQSAQ